MISDDRIGDAHKWWAELDRRRGERASLRRCSTAVEAYGIPSVHDLHKLISPLPNGVDFDDVCRAAILLASVKASGRVHPGQRLAAEGFSIIRFQRLIRSTDDADIIRNMRRAILSVDGIVNVQGLVRGVLTWNAPETRKTWAITYYENVKGDSK